MPRFLARIKRKRCNNVLILIITVLLVFLFLALPWSSTELMLAEDEERAHPLPHPISYTKTPETGLSPHGDQVVLLMASDSTGNRGTPIANIYERAVENRREYCDWHGYIFHQVNLNTIPDPLPGAHVIWKKIPAIQQAFAQNPTAEWVWWLDLDAVIMTAHVPLSTYLLHPSVLEAKLVRDGVFKGLEGKGLPGLMKAEEVNLIVSQDTGGLNAGSLLFRRSEWTDLLLSFWTDPLVMERFQGGLEEQDALLYLLGTHEAVRNHTGVVSQHVINAYAVGEDGGEAKWRRGDLAVHFAGCWWGGADCSALWEEYWAKRSPVPRRYLKEPRVYP